MLCISQDGQPLITLDFDGTATFGKRYSPKEAAKVFWEHLQDDVAFERAAEARGFKVEKANR